MAYFQGLLLLVSGRVSIAVLEHRNFRRESADVSFAPLKFWAPATLWAVVLTVVTGCPFFSTSKSHPRLKKKPSNLEKSLPRLKKSFPPVVTVNLISLALKKTWLLSKPSDLEWSGDVHADSEIHADLAGEFSRCQLLLERLRMMSCCGDGEMIQRHEL